MHVSASGPSAAKPVAYLILAGLVISVLVFRHGWRSGFQPALAAVVGITFLGSWAVSFVTGFVMAALGFLRSRQG